MTGRDGKERVDSGAGSVVAARSAIPRARGSSILTSALQSPVHLRVSSIPAVLAKSIVIDHHYLHAMPGGTQLCLGISDGDRLFGVLTLGVGPANVHRMVDGAEPSECLTLTRLWLSDDLPHNSESRVLGVVLRYLRRETSVKFVVSYADPSAGHVGTIYQAGNWIYTGTSLAMPLLDLGDGRARHSRSLVHEFGTHSLKHFKAHGINVRRIPQSAKHRYLYFLDRSWRDRLLTPILPYPKNGDLDASN
jgi:hypothetical protein